jgi:endonuclease/exonuclease/phosphatase family metal-dependent hydrolase
MTRASTSQWHEQQHIMRHRHALPLLLLALFTWTHESPHADALACLGPVSGVTWLRWEDRQQTLDRWCQSVGPPVFTPAPEKTGEISRLLVLSWNVHVGGGDTEELIAQMLDRSSEEGTGLVVLLQEAFRAGADVPESYPSDLRVPSSIRPRRPTPDIAGIAERFGMSVAYVPSMRNGPAASLTEREDRGNAVLSTEPLTDVLAIELPFGKQRRVAVAATVTPRSTLAPIRVVAAHFDPNGDRVAQAEALGDRIASLAEMPVIVGGDFNARRGVRDRTVAMVSRHVRLESCGTHRTNRWPLRVDVPLFFVVGRLDFMFSTLASDVTRSCQTLPHAYDSDHLPVLLDVSLR